MEPKSIALPLGYTPTKTRTSSCAPCKSFFATIIAAFFTYLRRVGLEPTMSKTTDLQSAAITTQPPSHFIYFFRILQWLFGFFI
jgi:hypothetical protein